MNLHPENSARVDAYSDGAMTPAERAALETDMALDRSLADEVELQKWIDAELREAFAIPEIAPPRFEAEPRAIPIRAGRRWLAPLAAAAVLALVGIGVWLAMRPAKPSGPLVRLVNPQTVYDRMASRDFKPEFVCTSDEEFRGAVQKRLGVPLDLERTPDVQVAGWAYTAEFPGKVIGERTLILLTAVGGAHPVVLMDLASVDRPLELPAGSSLHLFRRQVGPVVAYEVTPLAEPRVLGRLREVSK